ncbi:UNVERIFIED_CONTAM: hypothetical protein RMT77_009750 [Armadillidium vulgare]|nr:Syntenin-1 [Armadillidium vulgare]
MSMYPSLEELKVDKIARGVAKGNDLPKDLSLLYPTLNEYMGLEFTQDVLAANMPEYLGVAYPDTRTVSTVHEKYGTLVTPPGTASQLSPLSHGVRELVLCKDAEGKIGVRVKDINKGVFVSLVTKGSPAAIAGLKFGDQILQINGKYVAGMSLDSVHSLLKRCPSNGIEMIVRDRPYERTIKLYKDSANRVGFQFKDGEITAVVKDSSAARNGLLINHQLLEVNGQNVVGLKDSAITEIVNESGDSITITIMPSFVYKHIIKSLASNLVSKLMDHSVPV